MNRFIKYSKGYRKAVICIAIAIATVVYVAAAAISLSTTSSFLGLNSVDATITLFFIPSITGAFLILGINFWYVAENKRMGWFGSSSESKGKRDFSILG